MTVGFVMLAEVLIFVPSIARFRAEYLMDRLERAQIAALAVLAAMDEPVSPEVEAELLAAAGVYNVVLQRDKARELVLSTTVPAEVSATYDLRDAGPVALIRDAARELVASGDSVIRVIGEPIKSGGRLIEVTMSTAPLRAAMIDYGWRILQLSAVISAITATLLFFVVRAILVMPIRRVVRNMQAYTSAPEDARRIIEPRSRLREIRDAEEALRTLQLQLTRALRQKEHLAALGRAVAKISHDLRNILTSATLLADRMELSEDPTVKRLAPRLVRSLTRAVHLCEGTLAFGRAEEAPPSLAPVDLADLVDEVVEAEELAASERGLATIRSEVPPHTVVRADAEQFQRVLQNIVRNARQAIEQAKRPGDVVISVEDTPEAWTIRVRDTGPGLPPKARENLFRPFQGGARRDGTGLGLAIAEEIVRGHGGTLALEETSEEGTSFVIRLPKRSIALTEAAE